jgi:hypothetical protein
MTDRATSDDRTVRQLKRLVTKFSVLVAIGAILAAFWSGAIPQRISPISPLDLSDNDSWFLDFRLTSLRHDKALCAATLKAPILIATPISDQPYKDGCGWINGVRMSSASGAKIPVNAMTCEMAAAFGMWVAHVVQPAAERHFKSSVTGLLNMGGYSCRNIIGTKIWQDFRSQHATANALDIGAFTLADGRRISLKKDWLGDTTEAKFLRDVHRGACRYFRVVLGPDYNAAHHDHFHFDRGYLKTCR